VVLSICAVRNTARVASLRIDHTKAGVAFEFAARVPVDGRHILVEMIGGGNHEVAVMVEGRGTVGGGGRVRGVGLVTGKGADLLLICVGVRFELR
jgi:hypothetical protein